MTVKGAHQHAGMMGYTWCRREAPGDAAGRTGSRGAYQDAGRPHDEQRPGDECGAQQQEALQGEPQQGGCGCQGLCAHAVK